MCLKGFKKYCHSENVGNLSREMEPNENCGIKMQYSKWKMYWVCLTADPEKAMALHSSTLAWKILWMEEPGGLQSMGSHRVRHNWSDLAAAAAAGSSIKRLCKEISGRIFLYQFCMSYYFCIHWTSVWNSLSFCMYFLLFVQIMTWDKWWGTKASLILLTL